MDIYRFIIKGKVQKVFFRKSVSQNAMKAGYRGTIKNLPDGTVEVYAMLLDDELNDFLTLLRQGSFLSEVSDIEYTIANEHKLIYDGFVVL